MSIEKKLDKDTKEWGQFIASLVVLVMGIVMVFVAMFIPPLGVIDPSVIGVFGMFLAFVGSVWQIDIKYTYKARELECRLGEDIINNRSNKE